MTTSKQEASAEFAAAWRRAIGAGSFIPSHGGSARAALREWTEELAAALTAEPFQPAVGRRVGAG
ncbi:MAG TPA: hypothetical protein VJT31_14695, partial [Rugosimonospora sp.]|nr:hypothetical protein [Rugosimonospora sp.]